MTTIWNASLYDKKHDFVSKFGGSLVDLLAPQKKGKYFRCRLWYR
ncbi:hypothetical protein ABH968_002829 [Lysinibacillus sp. RC79]